RAGAPAPRLGRGAGGHPIVSLTTLIVAVRVAALTRPGARYAERLCSHDLAFRALGNVRTRGFAAIEPLAPAGRGAPVSLAPRPGSLLGAGPPAAAVLGPLVAARVVARSQRRQAALRARLTADLVDALDAADELWLN